MFGDVTSLIDPTATYNAPLASNMGFLSTVPADAKTSIDDVHHDDFVSTTVYGSAVARDGIPRFELAEEEMPARTAMRVVHDELLMVIEFSIYFYSL